MQHQQLANGQWQTLTFLEQMANIGSEVERTINWKNKNNIEYSVMAANRALELIDLSLNCAASLPKLKELARLRELFVDSFYESNSFQSTQSMWQNYFQSFAVAYALTKSA